jgi:hypothetical protein
MSRTAERAQAAGSTLAGNLAGLARTLYLDIFGVAAMGTRPLVYDGVAPPHAALTAALALAFLALSGAALWARRAALRDFFRQHARARTPLAAGLALVAAAAGWYAAALLVLWTVGNNDPIHTRYAAPLHPLLLVLAAAVGAGAARGAAPNWPRRALVLAALLVMLPNLAKSVALLSREPSPALLEVESRQRKIERWYEEVPWRP